MDAMTTPDTMDAVALASTCSSSTTSAKARPAFDRFAVVIPVKRFTDAKCRLAGLLPDDVRAAVARSMYLDVLDAVTRAVAPADVIIVTADHDAAAIAAARGCGVVVDSTCTGTRQALVQGIAHVTAAGYRTMLALPADVPLVDASDVTEIVRRHPQPAGVTLVASSDGRGTNALCCSPPDAIEPQHGDDSFGRHLAAARARGHPVAIVDLARIALDVDDADDIAAFIHDRSATRTAAHFR